jgi:hypothetical protein
MIRRDRGFAIGFVAILIASVGCKSKELEAVGAETPAQPETPKLALPERPADAEVGSVFLTRTQKMAPGDCEDAIFTAISRGDVPAFERKLVTIELRGPGASGKEHRIRLAITPDYLAIGSDADFARVPMLPATAQRIASLTGASLPTPKLVDAIYKQAPVKLSPRAINLDPKAINDRAAIATHQRLIEEMRIKAGARLGALTAGDKKDIVLSNQLSQRPDRVAIYGWQKEDGTPIQPLSTLHEKTYADYSHGVRLVAEACTVDGQATTFEKVLRDPELTPLVSDEGPMLLTSYPR